MATKEERLKALEQKQAQIKAQIQALKARDTAQDRKDDTRRKVLLGGFVLAQMKKKGIGYNQMTYEDARFVDTLNNDRDRALFGLAAKPALSPAGEAGGRCVQWLTCHPFVVTLTPLTTRNNATCSRLVLQPKSGFMHSRFGMQSSRTQISKQVLHGREFVGYANSLAPLTKQCKQPLKRWSALIC